MLARIGAERADERLARQDARRLRQFINIIEPVTHLALSCSLAGRPVGVTSDQRLAHVHIGEDGPAQVLVVWNEHPWPPGQDDAEALATALCDILGVGYFESFLALIQASSDEVRDRLLRRAGAPRDIDEKRALLQGTSLNDVVSSPIGHGIKTAVSTNATDEPVPVPEANQRNQVHQEPVHRTPLFTIDDLLIDGHPVRLTGMQSSLPHDSSRGDGATGTAQNGRPEVSGYGGNTDLAMLNELGMSIAMAYERTRLWKTGLAAEILNPLLEMEQPEAFVFDVSSPTLIERASERSPRFDMVMKHLQNTFGVSLEWPGFDILSLDPRRKEGFDRLIELKSSGSNARIQEMSWNEWKAAGVSSLRHQFFLYLVGNLRADLPGSVPFVRTIQDPFGQLAAEARVSRITQRKVQLAVHHFKEAETSS